MKTVLYLLGIVLLGLLIADRVDARIKARAQAHKRLMGRCEAQAAQSEKVAEDAFMAAASALMTNPKMPPQNLKLFSEQMVSEKARLEDLEAHHGERVKACVERGET